MVYLTEEETELISGLVECLEAAVAEADIDLQYANKTKLQKLLFLAIEEFDLPITYSWYLAGAVVPDDPVTHGNLETPPEPDIAVDQPAPATDTEEVVGEPVFDPDDAAPSDPLNDGSTATDSDDTVSIDPVLFTNDAVSSEGDVEEETSDEFVTDSEAPPASGSPAGSSPTPSASDASSMFPSSSTGPSLSHDSIANYVLDPHAVVDFYTEVLPTVWYQKTMRFLQNFYTNHAPANYKSLYLTSIHLRTHLLDAEEVVRARLEGRGPEQSLRDVRERIELEVSDLHYYIQSDDQLATTLERVISGTTVIEDAMLMLEQHAPDDLTTTHLAVVKSLQEFFYYYVWRYPCLIISRETATGPKADALRAQREGRLFRFSTQFAQECTTMQEELAAAGLAPATGDIPVPDDGTLRENLAELTEEYLQR